MAPILDGGPWAGFSPSVQPLSQGRGPPIPCRCRWWISCPPSPPVLTTMRKPPTGVGVDVVEGEDFFVFMDFLRRQRAGDDFAKKAVRIVHGQAKGYGRNESYALSAILIEGRSPTSWRCACSHCWPASRPKAKSWRTKARSARILLSAANGCS